MPNHFRIPSILHLPYLPVIVAPILLMTPVLVTGKALFWGTPTTQFVPWWTWSFDSLLSGRIPLWNPLVGMGAPLIANLQSALFYPPTWIYLLSFAIGGLTLMTWSQALLLTMHLIWAGIGMIRLTERLGYSKLAQAVSSLAFGLSGYLVSRAWFASINAAVAWLPWIIAGTYDLVHERNPKKSLWMLTVTVGMQLLAGHAQTSWYTLLMAGIFCGFWSIKKNRSNKRAKWHPLWQVSHDLFLLGIGILVGVGIASVQLLPTAEYLLNSQRATAAEYEAAMTYSFWPWRMLGLISPNLFGNPVTGNYWGYGNFWEDAIYVGLLPFLLGGAAFLEPIKIFFRSIGKRKDRIDGDGIEVSETTRQAGDQRSLFDLPILLSGLIVLSLLLAFGKNTPVFPWLYDHIPTFDMFQSPTRFSIWLVFSLALGSGMGIDLWKRPVDRGLYWTRLGIVGALSVSLSAWIGWVLFRGAVTDFRPTFVSALALTGILGAGAGILSLTAPKQRSHEIKNARIWQWSVVIWICFDLVVAGWGLNPGIGLDFYSTTPGSIAKVQEMVDGGRVYLPQDDEYTLRYEVFFNFDSFEPATRWEDLRPTLLPNLNILEGIPSVNNYDPLIPGYYATWMEKLASLNNETREGLLDFMGVTVLESHSLEEEHGVEFIPREGGKRIHWTTCVRHAVDEEEALELLMSGDVNLRKEVVLSSNWEIPKKPCYAHDIIPKILQDNGNEIVIAVEAPKAGWLVLADIWYPGWQAKINGERVEIHKANYAFKAIRVPAGSHEVVFLYKPASFYAGGLISVCSIVGIGWFYSIQRKIELFNLPLK